MIIIFQLWIKYSLMNKIFQIGLVYLVLAAKIASTKPN
jgi:hypothetical protein